MSKAYQRKQKYTNYISPWFDKGLFCVRQRVEEENLSKQHKYEGIAEQEIRKAYQRKQKQNTASPISGLLCV